MLTKTRFYLKKALIIKRKCKQMTKVLLLKLNFCDRKREIVSSMCDLRRGVYGKVEEGTSSFVTRRPPLSIFGSEGEASFLFNMAATTTCNAETTSYY